MHGNFLFGSTPVADMNGLNSSYDDSETDEAVMTSSSVVLNMASYEEDSTPDDIDLSIPEVIDLIELAVNSNPQLIDVRPYEVALTSIENAISQTSGVYLNLVEAISDSETLREFVYLLLNGFIKTRNSLKKKIKPQPFTVVYIPEKALIDPSVINISGQYTYKGKPVISFYNKSIFEDIIHRSYDVRSDMNVLDTIMDSTDSDLWNKIGVDTYIEFDIQTMTNLEIATMVMEGSVTNDIIDKLPNTRKNKINNLLNLLQ